MPKKLILSDEELAKVINLYQSGVSIREISKIVNHDRRALAKILKENNILIRDNSINSRKYEHDYSFFESIDSEVKAYWLGFIYADGFIESKRSNGNQKLGITLSKVDKKHLFKFKENISATNPVFDYRGSGYVEDKMFSKILLTSQKTVDDIRDKGVLENKTHILEFPTEAQVPQHLISHFMRGYFDGDGSLSYYFIGKEKRYYEMNIIGTESFLNAYQTVLGKSLKLGSKDDITFQLHIGGNQQLRKLTKFLYKDATVYLDRKYDKALGLLKYTER